MIGDFIILRSDGVAGYNFAAVVDDRDMGITHVIRGDDHLTNTARQLLLFEALGAPAPRFAHHSLVLGPDGGKLSKRHGATSVGEYRELGYLPEAIVNYLALLGWSHGEDEVLTWTGLSPSSSSSSSRGARPSSTRRSSIGSTTSTSWRSRRRTRAPLRGAAAGRDAAAGGGGARGGLQAVARRLRRRAGPGGGGARRAAAAAGAAAGLGGGGRSLRTLRALRAAAADWLAPAGARDLLAAYRAWGRSGARARELLMPLRIALTGREHGPELPYVLAALDRDTAPARLDRRSAPGTLPARPRRRQETAVIRLFNSLTQQKESSSPATQARSASTAAARPSTTWCTSATPGPTSSSPCCAAGCVTAATT